MRACTWMGKIGILGSWCIPCQERVGEVATLASNLRGVRARADSCYGSVRSALSNAGQRWEAEERIAGDERKRSRNLQRQKRKRIFGSLLQMEGDRAGLGCPADTCSSPAETSAD